MWLLYIAFVLQLRFIDNVLCSAKKYLQLHRFGFCKMLHHTMANQSYHSCALKDSISDTEFSKNFM